MLTELLQNENHPFVCGHYSFNTKVVEDADDLMEHSGLFLDLVDELSCMAFPEHDFDVGSIQAASTASTLLPKRKIWTNFSPC